MTEKITKLIETARRLGASDAAVVSSAEITVEDDLAALCNGEPRCENYGLAPSCPPHVSGPAAFRKWRLSSDHF